MNQNVGTFPGITFEIKVGGGGECLFDKNIVFKRKCVIDFL